MVSTSASSFSNKNGISSDGSSMKYDYTTFEFPASDKYENDTVNNSRSNTKNSSDNKCCDKILSTYIGPRVILTCAAAIYASNFPLGALMDESLPSSAATFGRMMIAAIALSPFLFKILISNRGKMDIIVPSIASGMLSGIGYITQSIALQTTNPARVSFLGSATVLVVPLCEAYIDKIPMSIYDAPQTWLAALLCFLGVGILELHHTTTEITGSIDMNVIQDTTVYSNISSSGIISMNSTSIEEGVYNSSYTFNIFSIISLGDILALTQAIGFGTSCFINSKTLRKHPNEAISVTSIIITTTTILSFIWSLYDGWIIQPNWYEYTVLIGIFHRGGKSIMVAFAILWTGLISTSFNYSLELTALGYVPASEASVILASEPLFAAFFASLFYRTSLTVYDITGGLFIVAACIINALLTPSHFGCANPNKKKEYRSIDNDIEENMTNNNDEVKIRLLQ